ncbi:MAG: two-component system sensor histidine kinase NtrB [Myxococcota bacterium]
MNDRFEDEGHVEEGSQEPPNMRQSGQIPIGQRAEANSGSSDEWTEGSRGAPHTPPPDQVLYTVLGLSRQVNLEMNDEEIVHAYTGALNELFPHRLLVIRLVDREGRLALAYATGRLSERRRGSVEITRNALERHGYTPDSILHPGVTLVEAYEPVFEDGVTGFDVPMIDGGRVVGVLGVEYEAGVQPPPDDRPVLGQIALQLGAALRNARLLRESRYLKDYLGKLVDHANLPIAMLGRRRDIRVINQALLALTGLERHEVLGQDFLHLLPESERPQLLPVFVNALRGKPVSNFDLNLPRRDGSTVQLSVNVASILSPDGEVEGVIAIGRDRTEVRELEQQVIQAEKLATLGQLAAGVVHELNNPLTSISAYGEYLVKKNEAQDGDPGDREKLRRIVQSADRILRFTRDLVTYARPSAEEPRFVSVDKVIDQAIVFCEHVIGEVGAEVNKSYEPGLPPVYGVEGQLHQVLINLITNACHAIPQGAGRLMVEAVPVNDDLLEIRVTDNGPGIPEDQQQKIFEPFFTTKGEGKGTGLGLSIVRNIVEQHGGALTVRSAIGEGTTFVIRLPCTAGA